MPDPEFVEGGSVGGTGFDPCSLARLGWVCGSAADHPGTVTLDERGGAFPGPGFTGSFEGGILRPLVVALVHRDDLAEVPGAAPVVQIPIKSGGHGFAAGADHEDELLKVIRRDIGGGAGAACRICAGGVTATCGHRDRKKSDFPVFPLSGRVETPSIGGAVMKYHVRHRTTYAYPGAVSESHHLARLHPRSDNRQRCLSHTVTILPEPAVREERTDAFGNLFTFFALQASYEVLVVEAESVVETYPVPLPVLSQSPSWEAVAEMLAEDSRALYLDAQAFRFPTRQVPVSENLADYARLSFTPGRPLLEAAMALTSRIFNEFKFDPSATTTATPVETVLKEKRGVCQDFAHLEIACLRSLGLAARYVSGYLETRPPPGRPRQIGADASHAWISVYDPFAGWIDFDPTNNCIPGPLHLLVAWGRDFSDVSPLRGVTYGGGPHEPKVMVDVIPQPAG